MKGGSRDIHGDDDARREESINGIPRCGAGVPPQHPQTGLREGSAPCLEPSPVIKQSQLLRTLQDLAIWNGIAFASSQRLSRLTATRKICLTKI